MPATRGHELRSRSGWAPYVIAVALALGALGMSRALAEVTDRPLYAILIAAVAISLWRGGLWPGLVTLAVGWALAPFVVETGGALMDRESAWRWGVSLVFSLAIVWVAVVLRRRHEQAATAAIAAESSSQQMETLQQLGSALVAAVEPSDVARELLRRTPEMIGARGGSLGLVDGRELVIIDPGDVAFMTHRPGVRLPLTALAPITIAAATGQLQSARSREELEARFPDGAALAPYARAALAVPLCVTGEPVGSLSLLFDRPEALDEDAEAIALIVADLGGQALERAGLYERERQSREALDRILRVTPRFHAGSAAEVASAICREARVAFGSDFAALWRLREGRLSLLRSEPELASLPIGFEVPLEDFPGLADAIGDLQASFVPDVLNEARGAGLELVRDVGIRSSFRIPVTISGGTELILSVSWEQVVSEPDASTVVLAQRFADQAGLALEQLERREAQVEAASRSRETRRLLEVTAALAAATTPAEVTGAILNQGLASLGAIAGVVVCRTDEPELLEVVDSRGYREATIDPWRRIPVDAPVPLAEAVRGNALIAIEDLDELARRYPSLVQDRTETSGAWLALPLGSAGAVIGAAGFSFAGPRVFSESDIEFANALARQSGQALDRALLLDAEYTARTRAEDMVVLTSALSQAVSPSDVVAELSAQILPQAGLDLVGVYMLDEAGHLDLVQTAGLELGSAEPGLRQLPLDGTSLPAEVARLEEPVWPDAAEDASHADLGTWAAVGVRSLGAVPLVADRNLLGVLVVGSSEAEIGSDARALVEIVAQQAAQPLERAWLMDRERTARVEAERASTLTRRLQSMTQSLAAAATPAEVGAIVVHEARDALSADAAALLTFDRARDAPELLAQAGLEAAPLAVELTGPIVEAALGGSPLVIDARTTGVHTIEVRSALSESGLQTVVSVPVSIGTRVLGAVIVGFRTPQPIAVDDTELLETLARIGGQALDRSRLFDEEQRLRRRSERMQSMTAALSGSLTQRDVAEVVVETLVHAVGASGSALSRVVEERGIQEKLAWRGYDDIAQEPWRVIPLDAPTPGNHALRTREMVFYESLDALARDFPESAARMRSVDHSSFLFVPLIVGGAPNGLFITSWERPVVLSDEDRTFIEAVASQTAQALDRARHFESERTIAETLQRSVLPVSLPRVETVQLAARYLPGTEEIDVGGDWFDAIQLPNGRLGLAVGDVVGKGVQSAATMAQLRNGLRAFALDQMKPSSTIARLNRLAEDMSEGAFATVVYAVLDHETGVCRLTSAGHPPPLVVYPDGSAEYIEGGRGLPLGTGADFTYRHETVELPVGSTVLFYTDGLVERRSEPIDTGLERLRQAAQEAPADPELLVEHVLERLVGDAERGDDIVALAFRLLVTCPRNLELRLPARPRSLDVVRDALRVWLQQAPLTQAEAYDVVLAAWEACANAIEHPAAEDGAFAFRAVLEGSSVAITIEDPGPWLAEAERADRGLGLRLMRSLMSSLEIDSSGAGTVVRLQKTLARDDADLVRTTRRATGR